MEAILPFILSIVGAYLLGAIPFGLLAGKLVKGIDIRQYGSGNLGATNVARTLGIKVGSAVMILDALKGFLPVFLLPGMVAMDGSLAVWFPVALGLAAIIGHTFPVYLRFKGGKGVATSLGACLAVAPVVVGIGASVFVITALVSRWISLASIVAITSAAAASWAFYPQEHPQGIFFSILTVLIIYRHKSNIARLLNGTEPKFGTKAACKDGDNGES